MSTFAQEKMMRAHLILIQERGVSSAGFTITTQPQAIAGII